METLKKILDIILQFLKFREQQVQKEEEYKIELEEKTKLEVEVNNKAKKISEKKKREKVNRSSDNVFGD